VPRTPGKSCGGHDRRVRAYVALDAQETHQLPALSRVALLEVFGTLDAQRHYQQQCQQPRATSGGPKIKGQFLSSLGTENETPFSSTTDKDFGCARNVCRKDDSGGGLQITDNRQHCSKPTSFNCSSRRVIPPPHKRHRCGVASRRLFSPRIKSFRHGGLRSVRRAATLGGNGSDIPVSWPKVER